MSLEQIFERTECWCSTNVRRQNVPRRRTGDAECSIPFRGIWPCAGLLRRSRAPSWGMLIGFRGITPLLVYRTNAETQYSLLCKYTQYWALSRIALCKCRKSHNSTVDKPYVFSMALWQSVAVGESACRPESAQIEIRNTPSVYLYIGN